MGISLNFSAKVCNMDFDKVQAVPIVRPDARPQLFSREHFAGGSHQNRHEAELIRGKSASSIANCDTARCQVKLDVAKLQCGASCTLTARRPAVNSIGRCCGAAYQRLDASGQLDPAYRLPHAIVCACGQQTGDIILARAVTYRKNRHRGGFPQRSKMSMRIRMWRRRYK
jgi:hypothetical protein